MVYRNLWQQSKEEPVIILKVDAAKSWISLRSRKKKRPDRTGRDGIGTQQHCTRAAVSEVTAVKSIISLSLLYHPKP